MWVEASGVQKAVCIIGEPWPLSTFTEAVERVEGMKVQILAMKGARVAQSVSARPWCNRSEFDPRISHPFFDFFPFSVA